MRVLSRRQEEGFALVVRAMHATRGRREQVEQERAQAYRNGCVAMFALLTNSSEEDVYETARAQMIAEHERFVSEQD